MIFWKTGIKIDTSQNSLYLLLKTGIAIVGRWSMDEKQTEQTVCLDSFLILVNVQYTLCIIE